MKEKRTIWSALGFAAGLVLGCSTASVMSQPEAHAPPQPAATTYAIVGPDEAERRYAPNGKAEAALYVSGEQAFVGVLEMVGGARIPTHRDPTEEFIYVLSGSGTITIDGAEHAVGPETVVYMPANAEVSFANGPEPMKVVQVFADPGPEAKFSAWPRERP